MKKELLQARVCSPGCTYFNVHTNMCSAKRSLGLLSIEEVAPEGRACLYPAFDTYHRKEGYKNEASVS